MKENSTRNKINILHNSTNNNTINLEIHENVLSKILNQNTHKYPSFELYDSGWIYYSASEIMGG